MVNLVKLKFNVLLYCHDELVSDLGEDLARWLEESWFNGEDVLEVEFDDYEVVN